MNLHDVTQTENWIPKLFGLEMEFPLTQDRVNRFPLKAAIFMVGLVLLRFLMIEETPSILGLFFVILFYLFGVFTLVKFILIVNKIVNKKSFVGIFLCLLPLLILVMVL